MSGKRAKPSRWRHLRVVPLVVAAVVVWVAVGLFLLFPGSGAEQAQETGIEPVPSERDDDTADVTPRPGSAETTQPAPAPRPTPGPRQEASPAAVSPSPQPSAVDRRAAGGATGGRIAPAPRPALQPASAAPSQAAPTEPATQTPQAPAQSEPAAGPATDNPGNPGKKKGHHDGRGPNDQR